MWHLTLSLLTLLSAILVSLLQFKQMLVISREFWMISLWIISWFNAIIVLEEVLGLKFWISFQFLNSQISPPGSIEWSKTLHRMLLSYLGEVQAIVKLPLLMQASQPIILPQAKELSSTSMDRLGTLSLNLLLSSTHILSQTHSFQTTRMCAFTSIRTLSFRCFSIQTVTLDRKFK